MPEILEEVLIQRNIVADYEGCATEIPPSVNPPSEPPPPITGIDVEFFDPAFFSIDSFSRNYFL